MKKNPGLTMKSLIQGFSKTQRSVLGYERYRIRSMTDGAKATYCVDIFTRSGIVIKTKYSYLSDETLGRFISHTVDSLSCRLQPMHAGSDAKPLEHASLVNNVREIASA